MKKKVKTLKAGTVTVNGTVPDSTTSAAPSAPVSTGPAATPGTTPSAPAADTMLVEGTTVVITPVPDAGYKVGTVSYTTSQGTTDVTPVEGAYSFEMPAFATSVAVTFSARSIVIKYDKNAQSAEGEISDGSVAYDDPAAFAEANAYSNTGKTFLNWNTSPDGTGTPFYAGDSILALARAAIGEGKNFQKGSINLKHWRCVAGPEAGFSCLRL